jgi:hypothetical protein
MSNLSATIKSIQDVMRQDAGMVSDVMRLISLPVQVNTPNQEATCLPHSV